MWIGTVTFFPPVVQSAPVSRHYLLLGLVGNGATTTPVRKDDSVKADDQKQSDATDSDCNGNKVLIHGTYEGLNP